MHTKILSEISMSLRRPKLIIAFKVGLYFILFKIGHDNNSVVRQSRIQMRSNNGELYPGDPVITEREISKLKMQGMLDLPINTNEASSLQKIYKVIDKQKKFHDRIHQYHTNNPLTTKDQTVKNNDSPESLHSSRLSKKTDIVVSSNHIDPR